MPAQNLTCPKCGRIYHPTFKKCPACNTPAPAPAAAAKVQPVKCPACGRPFNPSLAGCPFCRAKAGPGEPPKCRLDYVGIAERAAEHNRHLLVMDFSPASIYALDVFFDEMWGTQGYAPNDDSWQATQGQVAVVMNFGCYFGEVMRRRWGGDWKEDPNQPGNPLWTTVVLPGGEHVYVIAKVFKRLKNGSEDALESIFSYTRSARNDKPGPEELESWLVQARHFEKVHRPDHALKFYDFALTIPLGADEKAKVKAARAAAEDAARNLKNEQAAEEARNEQASKPQPSAPPVRKEEPPPAGRAEARTTREPTPPAAAPPKKEEPAPAEIPDDSPAALRKRAEKLAESGTIQEAVEAYTKLLGVDPGDADAWRERGVGLALLQDTDGAVASLDRAIALQPKSVPGYDHKAVTLARVRRWDEALAALEAGLAAIPGNAQLLKRQGIFLGLAGRPNEAIASLDLALAADPNEPEPLYFKADNLRKLGDEAEAVRLLKEFCARVPAWKGKTGMEARKLLWAIQNPGRKLDPDAALEQSNLAWQKVQQGDSPGALEAYEAAVKANPLSGEDWLNLGATLAHLGRREEAVSSYDRALELLGPMATILRNKASALAALGRAEEALACHDEVIKTSPGDEDSLRGKAAILNALERPEEALACLEGILSRSPKNAETLERKADCLRKLKRCEEALKACDAAIALEPANKHLLLTKSLVLSDLGRADEAFELQKRAFADEAFAKQWDEGTRRLMDLLGGGPNGDRD